MPARRHLALLLVLSVGLAACRSLGRDAEAPPELAPFLREAKRVLRGQFDAPGAQVRFLGVETGAARDLVVLRFEVQRSPFGDPELAYLASRCRPLATFTSETFSGMGGGIGIEDFATDPELESIRADERPCPRQP